MMKTATLALLLCFGASGAIAKLAPLSDEAKAKAAEATAKTAWTNNVANYQLCRSMERVATQYHANAKKAGKPTPPPVDTPACTDPGPFAYAPPADTQPKK